MKANGEPPRLMVHCGNADLAEHNYVKVALR